MWYRYAQQDPRIPWIRAILMSLFVELIFLGSLGWFSNYVMDKVIVKHIAIFFYWNLNFASTVAGELKQVHPEPQILPRTESDLDFCHKRFSAT